MKVETWMEQERKEFDPTDEEVVEKRAQLLELFQQWEGTDDPSDREEALMIDFANLRMEKELFELGEKIKERYPGPEDAWWIAHTVYLHYAYFCLMERRLQQALDYYLKAAETDAFFAEYYGKYLAACYAELGDVAQADAWIERCMAHDQKAGKDGWLEWVDFASYFQATGRPERAVAICQSVLSHHQYPPQDIRIVMAKAYQDLGDHDAAIATYHAHVENWKNDDAAFFALGMAYYELKKDLKNTEIHLLHAIDLVKDDKLYILWIPSVYYSLAVFHFNNAAWMRGFEHLDKYYQWKYPPAEAAVFSDIIAALPEIEDDDTGMAYLEAIFEFEKSPVRATLSSESTGSASTNPTDEVKDATKGNFDWSNLTNLDDTQAN